MTKHILVTVGLIIIGVLLGTLGTISLPVGFGVTNFWPGVLVQLAGGIWFGGWGGIVAGPIFPIFDNLVTGQGVSSVLGFIPANLIQGLIPAWAFRHFGMPPGIPGWRGIGFFGLWGCIIPNVCGAALGVGALVLFGSASPDDYLALAWPWARANIIVAFILGVPLLRIGTPFFEEAGLLVKTMWR